MKLGRTAFDLHARLLGYPLETALSRFSSLPKMIGVKSMLIHVPRSDRVQGTAFVGARLAAALRADGISRLSSIEPRSMASAVNK